MAHLLDVNRAAVLRTYAMDNQRVAESLQMLREWLRTQPHLPPIDDVRLEKFLVNNKFRLEVTKPLVDAYFTVRTQIPELFADRDPGDPGIRRALATVAIVPLKPLTKTLDRVQVIKLLDCDVENYNMADVVKCGIMIEDLRSRYDYERLMHYVWDLSGVTFGHITKISPDTIAKGVKIYLSGYKLRFRTVHIIHPPPFVEAILALLKMSTPASIYKKVIVHSNLESFHEYIPKEILPSDLGGDLKSVKELFGDWVRFLEENRDWFLEEQKLLVDESVRPEKLNNDCFGSIHGSFRTLAID